MSQTDRPLTPRGSAGAGQPAGVQPPDPQPLQPGKAGLRRGPAFRGVGSFRAEEKNPHILLIDDSDAIRDSMRSFLEGEDLEVSVAADGLTGESMAMTHPPDLILLDVEMPDLDGFEVCRRLKDDPATHNIPIIFLTGRNNREQKIRGLDLGAVDYVTKPCDSAELLARVRAALRTKRLIDLLATRAQIDGLTGLWNRAYFDEHLPSRSRFASRQRRRVACLMIDIDHFKQMNDTHGHPTGDRVLQHVGRCLLEACRAEDVPCRYGGDEFAVIAHASDLSELDALAGRIHERVCGQPLRVHRRELWVGMTIGGAILQPTEDMPEPAEALITAADHALYEAKRAGRNRIVCREAGTADG